MTVELKTCTYSLKILKNISKHCHEGIYLSQLPFGLDIFIIPSFLERKNDLSCVWEDC